MTAMRFSVTVITKDEERNLARCLASAPFADEIVARLWPAVTFWPWATFTDVT